MTRKERILRDADDSLEVAMRIVARINKRPELVTTEDIQSLRTAASQARQSTMYLDQLLGMLEGELPD